MGRRADLESLGKMKHGAGGSQGHDHDHEHRLREVDLERRVALDCVQTMGRPHHGQKNHHPDPKDCLHRSEKKEHSRFETEQIHTARGLPTVGSLAPDSGQSAQTWIAPLCGAIGNRSKRPPVSPPFRRRSGADFIRSRPFTAGLESGISGAAGPERRLRPSPRLRQ